MRCVDILISTWNGAPYLTQQLQSIEHQIFSDWRLIARDDGSADSTVDILQQFATKHPSRVRIITAPKDRLGICGSYSALMAHATADYVTFCDQDDVWLPDKIEKTLACMERLEAEWGDGTPLLVHCDLMVADETLNRLHPSFWRYRKISPDNAGKFNRQLVMNVVTGCAMMINRALVEKTGGIPEQAMIHDWWIAQVAAAFGRVVHVPEGLVMYRQHGENSVGARGYFVADFMKRIGRGMVRSDVRRLENVSTRFQVLQARAFYDKYGASLSREHKTILENYLELYSDRSLFRFWRMARFGFWRTGLIRNIVMGMRPSMDTRKEIDA